MELIVDVGNPARDRATARDRSGERETDRAIDGTGPLGGPQARPYSFVGECECPDDCLRDHANE
jgi:hypothetical protein